MDLAVTDPQGPESGSERVSGGGVGKELLRAADRMHVITKNHTTVILKLDFALSGLHLVNDGGMRDMEMGNRTKLIT